MKGELVTHSGGDIYVGLLEVVYNDLLLDSSYLFDRYTNSPPLYAIANQNPITSFPILDYN